MPAPRDSGTKTKPVLYALAVTSTIGAELAITVTAGYFGGKLLDAHLGTAPWLLVTGVLLGVGAGIWGIITTLQRFWRM